MIGVVATARKLNQLEDLVAKYGAQVTTVRVDVTSEPEANDAVTAAVEDFGGLDVVVNNAGYGDLRPFEQVSSADFRALVETCFYGVVNVTRAALPVLRKQRRGHIIQISSLGGRTAFPGNAAYFAAKWAVGGFTEGLAMEVAPFGVKVTALEPGGMRTNWGKRASVERPAILPEYEDSVGALVRQLDAYWGNESGDPEKVAEVILRIAETEVLPPHILLGGDAYDMARQAESQRIESALQWEAVSRWTDVSSDGPMPSFPNK